MSLIADCFDVLLVKSDGTLLGSTTLSTADINITVDSTEVRAGRGNALISILRSNRQAAINLAEMTFKWDWIALQFGRDATTGAVIVYATPKWYETTAATPTKFTLDETPLALNSGLKIYDEDGVEVALTTGYTITGAEVTITGASAGDRFEVRGYKYTTGSTAETIEIDSISFPEDVKCILETIEIDEGQNQLSKIQYIFDKAIPDGNISIATKKEVDASVTNFNLKAIKPLTSNSIGRVVKIPLS